MPTEPTDYLADRALLKGMVDWVREGRAGALDLGPEGGEIGEASSRFVDALRAGAPAITSEVLTPAAIEIIRCACRNIRLGEPADLIRDGQLLFRYISTAAWPEPDFEERAELLWECGLSIWRASRSTADAGLADNWRRRLAEVFAALGPLREAILEDLGSDGEELQFESLAAASLWMDAEIETAPSDVLRTAEAVQGKLGDGSTSGLSSEEDRYFRGYIALRAGSACRILGLRARAREWLDQAEAAFRHLTDPTPDLSRLSYQRLALRAEERHFQEVLELAPSLTQSFVKLEMPEDALKCRFLEAAALKETEKFAEACRAFQEICRDAETLGNRKLQGTARYNLVQIHSLLGEAEKAILESQKALPLLEEQQNRVGIAKLQWGLAYLFRDQGDLPAAVDMFRRAQVEFREIGMRADMAAIQLVIADLLLDSGQEIQAEKEILAALPIIEELKMVPEGVAAIALLRESLRQRSINRQALRDLHGYFEELA